MNNCTFNGRLTKDPELKTTPNGKKYTRFVLAVKRRVKTGDHPQSDFIDCIAWDKLAEIITQYCTKGSQLGVIGRLQTNLSESYGETRKLYDLIVNEIDFIGGGKRDGSPADAQTTTETGEENTESFVYDPSLPFQL